MSGDDLSEPFIDALEHSHLIPAPPEAESETVADGDAEPPEEV